VISSGKETCSGLTPLVAERGIRELAASTIPAAVVTANGQLAAAQAEPTASVLEPATFNQN
jgi:hypothetical protein